MTTDQFNIQMERLLKTWPNSFPDERIKLIWTSTKDQSAYWFERLVSKMIASHPRAPLPTEFQEASQEQEKRGFQKDRPLNPINNSIFSKEDIKEMFQFLTDRMLGKYSHIEAMQYAQSIKSALESRGIVVGDF